MAFTHSGSSRPTVPSPLALVFAGMERFAAFLAIFGASRRVANALELGIAPEKDDLEFLGIRSDLPKRTPTG
ncbi:hypothetical protein [Propylenella binzhouense]|uniref:Uncharacterized protein n=1 Tax=Propylenella binzhouense TaxID=2555902 RepID=A0A964T601_9HYPH|nr:hypothetical protein [Propylenella binzhouense]MYZ49166.1 hypothetical protein [Propylenella binzhouense]